MESLHYPRLHYCLIHTHIAERPFFAAVIQPTLPESSSARNAMPLSSIQPAAAASKQQVAPYEPDVLIALEVLNKGKKR
jgi:hypothetical protein